MAPRQFHHGNLRAVLLEQAQVVLRDGGVEALSLRDLARQAGVSHGAPRSHFIDRQSLLDALAERGFDRLTEKVTSALQGEDGLQARFRRLGRAYVEFAVEDAALMELMFTVKAGEPAGPVHDAALRLFTVLDQALGAPSGDGPGGGARERFTLLFAAVMQGTATLVVARRVTPAQGRVLIEDATDALLVSELGARVLPER